MNMYILRRERGMKNGHPAYVAEPGSERGYTSSLARARVYQSRRAAEAERCGNEYAVEIDLSGQMFAPFTDH